MKKIIKGLSLVTMLLVVILATSVYGTTSEKTSETTFELNRDEPTIITIIWEEGDIAFELISPSGQRISLEESPKNCLVIKKEKSLNFILFEPEQGTWTAIYDKGTNESIRILADAYDAYYQPMWITELAISEVYDDKYMDVEFYVDNQGNNEKVDYEVSVALKEEVNLSKSLRKGRVLSDEKETVKVNLSSINSYEDYVIVLRISYEKDGMQIFDEEVSDVFAYKNVRNQERVNDFEVVLNDEGLGQIIIEPVDSYKVDAYIVNIYEDQGSSPSITKKLDNKELLTSFYYNTEGSNIRIEVMTEDNGIFSEAKVKEIDIKKMLGEKVVFTWPENGISNQKEFQLPYRNGLDKEVNITLNGNQDLLKLEENGRIKLLLEDGYNEVEIKTVEKEGIGITYKESIFLDDYPPQLFVYEDVNGLTTKNEFVTLLGNVEQGASLTCNGQGVEVDEEGEYQHQVPLISGENKVELTAIDSAGNTTVYTALIHKGTIASSKTGFLPLYIGLGVAVVLIVIYFITGIKRKKGDV